ncbi:hypothetical protein BKA81DRAFT_351160 [Phyllosticta paracitricarpa]|uniref:Transmembrane protein n=1 Tax=Phyllosticta paracitricarpa TaxID=2016321 RepID=A0ABR1NG94_9PEZI
MMDTHVHAGNFFCACLPACLLALRREKKKKKKKSPSIVVLYCTYLRHSSRLVFSSLLLGAAFRMSFVRSMYPRPLFCFQRFAISSLFLLCFALLCFALYQTTIITTTTPFWRDSIFAFSCSLLLCET